MIRALTIRFVIMAICIAPLVRYLNVVEAEFGWALAAVGVYCAIGASIIGYYMGTHLDDIPVRASRRDPHQN
jgi:ABC-type cobalt transport system substrate-binding protein